MAKKNRSYWLFRIINSRGTDISACVSLPLKATKEEAREAADLWSSRVTAGTACHDYTVQYRLIPPPPPRRVWLSQWKKRCEDYKRAKLARQEWLAMQDPKEMG